MNEELATATDGTRQSVKTVVKDPYTGDVIESQSMNDCRIYWPFAISEDFDCITDRMNWDVEHLPSGYAVQKGLSLQAAHALVKRLRTSGLSFDFTTPTGENWDSVRPIMKQIVSLYRPRTT